MASKINIQIRQQLEEIQEMIQENDPWLYCVYKSILGKIQGGLIMNSLTQEALEDIRKSLHNANSSIANMALHGAQEKDIINDAKIFSYLYSVIDFLNDIRMDEDDIEDGR